MAHIISLLSIALVLACDWQTPKHRKSIKALVEKLKEKVADKNYPKIDAIKVEHDNEINIEEYFNGFRKDSQHRMRSSFKSQ